jgi:hypothetical protein
VKYILSLGYTSLLFGNLYIAYHSQCDAMYLDDSNKVLLKMLKILPQFNLVGHDAPHIYMLLHEHKIFK